MSEPLLLVLPLASAVLWLAIGAWPFLRYRFASPIQQTLTGSAILLGAYALVDWVFFQTTDTKLALVLAGLRGTVFTFAVLCDLLAAKWIYYGHARVDPLLAAPAVASLLLVWGGMTKSATIVAWGPELVRNPVLYATWVGILVAYGATATLVTIILYRARQDLPARPRQRIVAIAASIGMIQIIWLATNVSANLFATADIPWFSSLLFVPAVLVAATFLRLSPEEIGEIFRAVSEVGNRVSAVYVFYRGGEPLVALGTGRTLPIDADQLQGVLDLVGNFVETSMRKFRGYAVTALHFDRLGILAVRGKNLIVAAIYEGAAYDALRSELLRSLQAFEQRHPKDLGTWEGSTGVAEELADDLAALLRHPRASGPGKPAPPG